MRVAWLVYGDLAQPTGGYVYDRCVVDGLRARGDEVVVVDPRASSDVPEDTDVVVGDALCAREVGPLFERVGHEAARLLLVHHLASWEIERPDGDAMRVVEVRALAASDRIVATSAATRARLAETPSAPVDVIVPGADRLRPHPREEKRSAHIELLFVGSLVKRKRIAVLLDALERLNDSRLALTLVGDASREPEHAGRLTARIAASSVLREQVALAGVVTDEALAQWLARADALVLPSSLEGYGMVVAEALSAGLPVLAAREVAEAAGLDTRGAVLVFDGVVDLAAAIGRFASDRALREAMGRAARATSLPRWESTITAFRESLVRALRGP